MIVAETDEAPAGAAARTRAGRSPWVLAFRRLRRNRSALLSLVVFVVVVLGSFAAPLYAEHVAETDPFRSNLSGKIESTASWCP